MIRLMSADRGIDINYANYSLEVEKEGDFWAINAYTDLWTGDTDADNGMYYSLAYFRTKEEALEEMKSVRMNILVQAKSPVAYIRVEGTVSCD